MITIDNILKIADVQKNQVSQATYNYLINFFVTYRDELLKEHLINIDEAIEDVTADKPELLTKNKYTSLITKEVKELHKVCSIKNEAGYIRFIEG